eukprot:3355981-Prymnesium_polylepis.1
MRSPPKMLLQSRGRRPRCCSSHEGASPCCSSHELARSAPRPCAGGALTRRRCSRGGGAHAVEVLTRMRWRAWRARRKGWRLRIWARRREG